MPLLAAGLAAQDVAVRTVEPGSRLVAVPSGGTVAVLQLPRGNLEVVSPRILVLKAIAAELQVNWAAQGRCCAKMLAGGDAQSAAWAPSICLTIPASCALRLSLVCSVLVVCSMFIIEGSR